MGTISQDEALAKLRGLFAAAGRELPELIEYIQHLELERERFRSEAARWKAAAAKKTPAASSMNSRLREALRE